VSQQSLVTAATMRILTPEFVFSYLQWRATEEEYDTDFFEQCAQRFDALREPFLETAEAHRSRARNISASLEFPPDIAGSRS